MIIFFNIILSTSKFIVSAAVSSSAHSLWHMQKCKAELKENANFTFHNKSCFLCFFFLLLSGFLRAQNDTLLFQKPDNIMSYEVIKTNPMAFLLGPTVISSEYGLSYEFSLSKTSSFSMGASLLNKNIFLYLAEQLDTSKTTGGNIVQVSPKLKISGYRVQAQYKWIMPLYNYPCGVYIGPHASFSTVYFSYQQRGFTKDFYRIVHNNISLLLGYQHFLNNKLFIDLYAGLGYKYNYVMEHKTVNDFKKIENEFIFTGIPGHVKLNLGYYIGYKF